jgi:hypothetical protein
LSSDEELLEGSQSHRFSDPESAAAMNSSSRVAPLAFVGRHAMTGVAQRAREVLAGRRSGMSRVEPGKRAAWNSFQKRLWGPVPPVVR